MLFTLGEGLVVLDSLRWFVTLFDKPDTAITALATLAIAIYTFVLARATIGTLNHLEREFDAAHRPRLILRNIVFQRENMERIDDVTGVYVEIANVGDADGIIADFWLEFVSCWTDQIDAWKIVKELDKKTRVSNHPLRTGDSLALIVPIEKITEGLSSLVVRRGRASVYCAGQLSYVHASGKHPRRTAFLRRINIERMWFEATNHPDFEYQD